MNAKPEPVQIADYAERYAAERERAARTDALEQACKAVCSQCKHGRKLKLVDGVWSHGVLTPGLQWKPCAAAAIRALINEVTPCSNG
jgi:uncharacterized protein YuzB (UPF0349 family)